MGVASWSFDLVWAVGGSGPAGAAPAEAVAGCPARLCGVAGCRVLCGVEDTPVLLLLPVFVWGWGLVGAPAWCGGGMLSGFWGSAPWLPGPCSAACWWVVGCGCGWVGCELYSGREHLTVSLRQVFCFVVCCVVCFYERSVDALASGADEGRGGLRYSSGSRLAGCDPRVSEWGDPARVMSCHLHLNCIGCGG